MTKNNVLDVYGPLPPFMGAERAFYITSPSWLSSELPYVITEDFAFVARGAPYRPLPFDAFYQSIHGLSKLNALRILPSQLKEPLDYNRLDDPIADLNIAYLLCNNVLIRIRKDSPVNQEDTAHTMLLIGESGKILSLTERIQLPHPFDDSLYPFRELFINNKESLLRVLK